MLVVEDLHVNYGRIPALQGVSIEVRAGEVVGLIGANGAGKTTTLGAIIGLLTPARGSIVFEGSLISGWAPERVARTGIALVPEGRQVFSTLTVAENLSIGTTSRRKHKDLQRDVERELDRFPILRKYQRVPAGRLSGGEQQQLAIARALVSRPRLLLLDEPSLGLAPQLVDLVFDVLAGLRDDGATILLVEQNAARTVDFADRTYVLRTGRIAAHGHREAMARSPEVASAYLGLDPA